MTSHRLYEITIGNAKLDKVQLLRLTLIEYLCDFLYTYYVAIWFNLAKENSNDSAGGSKGPARPLGGVRGGPAFLPHPTAGGGVRAKNPEELQKTSESHNENKHLSY